MAETETTIARMDGEIPSVMGAPRISGRVLDDTGAIVDAYRQLWLDGTAGRPEIDIHSLQFCDAIVDAAPAGSLPAWGYFLFRTSTSAPSGYPDHYLAGFGPGPEYSAVGAPMAWMVPLPNQDDKPTISQALAWLTPPEVWTAIHDGRDVLRHGDVYLIQSPAADRRLLSPRVYVAHVLGAETLPESHRLVQHAGKQHSVGDDIVPNLTIEHVEHGALEIPPTWFAAFAVVLQPRAVDAHGTKRDAVSGYIGEMGGWD